MISETGLDKVDQRVEDRKIVDILARSDNVDNLKHHRRGRGYEWDSGKKRDTHESCCPSIKVCV